MFNAINNITPLEAFTVLMAIISLVGAQVFSSLHKLDQRADGHDVKIIEIKMLGVKHCGWPEDIVLAEIRDTIEKRGDDPGLIEQFLKRGG